MSEANQCAVAIEPSFGQRIKRRLFPQHVYEWSQRRGEFMEENGNKGCHVEVLAVFDWLDRLRILFTGSIRVQVSIASEFDPGWTKSVAQVCVLAEKPERKL